VEEVKDVKEIQKEGDEEGDEDAVALMGKREAIDVLEASEEEPEVPARRSTLCK